MGRIAVLVLFVAIGAPVFAKRKLIGPDNAIAIAQTSGSDRVGWAAVLIGRGVVAGPRYHQWNLVTVETGPYQYQWQELSDKRRMIFTINEQFRFWRDGSVFLVVDIDGKTHRFGLVSALRR